MIESSEIDTKLKHELNPQLWVKNHGDYLYNFAYYRVNNKEVSEDVVQETFIAALKAQKSFRGESTELTWLLSILKRKVIDYFRKVSSGKERTVSDYTLPFQDEGMFEGHWLNNRLPKDWSTDADNSLNQEEFQQILEVCLSLLPPKWRSVFVLKFMEELNSDEVCKEAGCTPSNFWVIIHRARLKLRECIENKWL
ncbi:MAG: sigma-70 family RNA polymerase sigma factor [Bacteroidetes bacterium]|nr:sigma-70 family RNA polymerase sigma factor [Bacteroidota bacterium]